jgi:ribosomal protein S18 acetylase RimI-like enzyme
VEIRTFAAADEDAVVRLWARADLLRPWNDPRRDIARKVAVDDDLFLIGRHAGEVVGVVMAGYDGHRGWINYLAVDPAHRGAGLGRALIAEAERRLRMIGCPKINLQVRGSNTEVLAFYEHLGFRVDDAVSMGKRLVHDDHGGDERP